MMERFGRPKHKVLNHHIWENLKPLQRKAGDIRSKWTVFSICTVCAAVCRCDRKNFGLGLGEIPKTREWTPDTRDDTVKLKKDFNLA